MLPRRRLERQLRDTMMRADDLRLDERWSEGLLGRLLGLQPLGQAVADLSGPPPPRRFFQRFESS